ncbi:HSP20-like chaperone [Dichomitus squalens]|uniref:HSP20-like chaperone n=2 Tax=Dichomitus squalens TaxID=114155 RepID=A0A4Q9PEC0_9APHY|nr:HSP20-like chaperone [Dichomitus squalens LYAD-421 SS1]EJF58063.1 HSP20-like chaperone [Dichomitus squalens LYAD-421 SS1]TBU40144.1 HSP20-like chaperone [Dichomitus squalens]TBU53250.1 HSP20-like chaperone [Dichomitus squalens]
MALTFFTEPFYSLSDFDRLFDPAFNARARTSLAPCDQTENVTARSLRPRLHLHEDKDKNLITATCELPGLTKDNVLTVSGESNISNDRNEKDCAIRERRDGKFSRSMFVPQGIKLEDIKTSMENSVLTVTFPLTTPEQAPRKTTIA